MSYSKFLQLSDRDKADIYNELSEVSPIPYPFAIEKDWWVTQALRVIYSMTDVAPYLTFKGGTSLSKAWGIIDRFSEDIDIVLDQAFLGFDEGILTKSQVKKLRYTAHTYFTTTFLKNVKVAFSEAGFDGLDIILDDIRDSNQDPIAILVKYPSITDHPIYLLPRIKIEIGARGFGAPSTSRPVQSLVGTYMPGMPFTDSTINIPTVNPERTYLEKLFLLHEIYQRPQAEIRVDRMSRHLYDIWRIGHSDYAQKALDPQLIHEVIVHRTRFGMMRDVDYSNHYPPNLISAPPDVIISSWRQDYASMQSSMIYGDSPSFDDLIAAVTQATDRYNALTIDIDF